jgi:outer membrane protein assembly factor BamD (BamD/ComL family)
MSVAGILSSSLSTYNSQTVQSKMQQFQQEFQQLGQDLKSGNLSAAQSDFATLQQSGPQANSTASAQSTDPIVQAFNQLSTDLKSGNTTAAQQDYATIQKDFQNQGTQSQGAHSHHHHHGGGGSQENAISQMFQQLGQDLQSGQLSAAQQAYGSLQQDLQQFAAGNGLAVQGTTSSSGSSSVSLNA